MFDFPAPSVEPLLKQAIQWHSAGRLADAEELYQQILQIDPINAVAWNHMAALAIQNGRAEAALDAAKRAVASLPDYADAHNHMGIALSGIGRLDEAAASYRRALELNPTLAQGHFNLGLVLARQEETDKAIAAFERALQLQPDFAKAENELGVALQKAGRFEDAIGHFQRAAALRPEFAEAHQNLGVVLARLQRIDESCRAFRVALKLRPAYREARNNLAHILATRGEFDEPLALYLQSLAEHPQQPVIQQLVGALLARKRRFPEALASYRAAIALDPSLANAHHGLAVVLRELGENEAAIPACENAIRLMPTLVDAHLALASSLVRLGRHDEAKTALRRAIEAVPDSAVLRFELAAATGDQQMTSMPTEMIAPLFNGYAAEFDNHLVKKLEYQGPQLLFEAVTAVAPGRKFTMLDAGCGTGLCAMAFRSVVTHVAGVDLAPAMIEKCRARCLFDELRVGDVVSDFLRVPSAYDLIVAGDVLAYMGELATFFAGARHALRADGLVAFTVEGLPEGTFQLMPTKRFAHSLRYAEEAGLRHGLVKKYAAQRMLRKEGAGQIMAWIVVMQKV